MFGRRLLAVVMIVSLLSIGLPGGSSGVSANPSGECVQLAWYAGEMLAVGEQIDAFDFEEAPGPDMDHLEDWSAADFDQVLAFYDRIIITLQGIQPPVIATEFHQAFLQGIALVQEMLATMKSSGIFAMFAFLEPLADLNQQLADLSLPLELQCGLAILDHDQDGVLEVGVGAGTPSSGGSALLASPVAEPQSGTVVPIGTTVQTSEAFSLTIVSVDRDALAAVQEWNPESVPPAGFQYVNVELELGHLRDQTDTFALETLVALGPTGVAYSAVNNSCGPVFGPLSPGEYGGTLTMTGHVCFIIASQDVTGLRLYDATQPADERIYLSLDPEGN